MAVKRYLTTVWSVDLDISEVYFEHTTVCLQAAQGTYTFDILAHKQNLGHKVFLGLVRKSETICLFTPKGHS